MVQNHHYGESCWKNEEKHSSIREAHIADLMISSTFSVSFSSFFFLFRCTGKCSV